MNDHDAILVELRKVSAWADMQRRITKGRTEKAREHYGEAFRLLPTEENAKLLAAIDRRIKAGNLPPDNATNRSQPIR